MQLIAASDNVGTEQISAMDVVLSWDAAALELIDHDSAGAFGWLMAGFFNDAGADGLNNTFADGDAWFQALGPFTGPAEATPEGMLVTTLRFTALQRQRRATVRIEPRGGPVSSTRVFRFGVVGENIVGRLQAGSVRLVDVGLEIPDVTVPAGRTVSVVAFGEIADQPTFGVNILVELMPMDNAGGTVRFTPAPPPDVFEVGDPWPVAGSFTAFDTDVTLAEIWNGSVMDNGTFVPAPVSYCGPLAAFPVQASADARGEWVISLTTGAGESYWEGLTTRVMNGVLRIVPLSDGDGNGRTDTRDFADFQRCFTGAVGPIQPPAYPWTPQSHCAAYDSDDDGDVDGDDLAGFVDHAAGSGP